MKKLSVFILSLLIISMLSGCAEYSEPEGGGTTVPGQNVTTPDDDDDGEERFTVSLKYLGVDYVPDEKITVLWTDLNNSSVYMAEMVDGVASISGLDGEYRVTLGNMPEGFTYDPNIYTADNDNREVTISLLKLLTATGKGTNFTTDYIYLRQTGTYRATLNSPKDELYFKYQPSAAGVYSVTSLVDVTANSVNPILDVYIVNNGGYSSDTPAYTQDDGGECGTYTKNFKWEIQLDDDMVSNAYGFVIRTESLNASAFPINIDFVVERDGEYTGETKISYRSLTPVENFVQTPEYDKNTYKFVYAADMNGTVLDSRLYALCPDDGFYHQYDEETGTFGKVLYAKVSSDNAIIATGTGTGFLDGLIVNKFYSSYYEEYIDYTYFINAYGGYTNSDGVYAVTEELREYLQSYAVGQRLFNDGNGLAESGGGYNSDEEDQWLFACGCYFTR